MREVHVEELAPYHFSGEELQRIGKELAQQNRAYTQIELEKQQINAGIKAKLDTARSRISELSHAIETGFEMRKQPCEWRYNTPKPGDKMLVVKETGIEVRVERMTSFDMQEPLFTEETAADPVEETKAAAPAETAVVNVTAEEPVIEEKSYGYISGTLDVSLAACQRRDGWFWRWHVAKPVQTQETSLGSDWAIFPSMESALSGGAQSLHNRVMTAGFRPGVRLNAAEREDATQCMEWCLRIMSDPASANDKLHNRQLVPPPADEPEPKEQTRTRRRRREAAAATD